MRLTIEEKTEAIKAGGYKGFISIDDLNPTEHERDKHFFKKGYQYAVLHLKEGLKTEKLKGLEKTLIKHFDKN